MATAPLNSVIDKWTQRANAYRSAGIPDSAWQALAKQDIQTVSQGGTAKPREEVQTAVAAALGLPPIQDPKPKTGGGVLGGIEHVIGNVGGDITGIVKGFIPGAIQFAHHLPSETTDTINYLLGQNQAAIQKKYGMDPGEPLANYAKLPLLSLIPGVSDVGQLTTAKGRQELMAHPVTAAIDVAPGEIGKLAAGLTLGRDVARQVARTTPAQAGFTEAAKEVQAARAGTTMAGTPVEALARGQVVRAGARKLSDVLTARVPRLAGGPADRAFWAGVADHFGASAPMRENIVRAYSVSARGLQADAFDFIENKIGPILAKVSPQELEQIGKEARGLAPVSSEEHAAVIQAFHDAEAAIRDQGLERGHLLAVGLPDPTGKILEPPNGRIVVAKSEKVATLYQAAAKTQERLKTQMQRAPLLKAELDKMERALGPTPSPEQVDRFAKKQQQYFKLMNDQKKTRGVLEQRMKKYRRSLALDPPAPFQPIVQEYVRKEMEKEVLTKQANAAMSGNVKDLLTADQLSKALTTVREHPMIAHLQATLGKDGQAVYDRLLNEAAKNWMDMARAGFDPLWIHQVDPKRLNSIFYPKPLTLKEYTPPSFRKKVLNFTPGTSVAAGLAAAGVEVLKQVATEKFINDHVLPLVEDKATIMDDLLQQARATGAADVRAKAAEMYSAEFVDFSPETFGTYATTNIARMGLAIPKNVYHVLDQLSDGGLSGRGSRLIGLQGAADEVNKVFKFAVLTGPRHIAHVALGGMMFGLMREPGMLLQIPKALHMLKTGEAPLEVTQDMYNISKINTDKILNYSAGRQMANWLRQHWDQVGIHPAEGMSRLENHISNTYRVSAMLSAESRGLSHEAALNAAYKVFVDMDSMAPVERITIRHFMPFYAFTRHLFSYLFSYPADYPLRALILTKFAEQYQNDWNTGLPRSYQQLLFLGEPDSHGNIMTVDFRSINPFRSFANDFSLAGFFQTLSPLMTAPLEASGFNTLSGVGQLYPQITYDSQTGSLTAARPAQGWASALQSFIPQFGALDHFIQITNNMKQLKQSNPVAYRRALFSQLNLPFAWGTVNEPLIKARAEMNRYRAAQAAVSAGTKAGGSFAGAERYNLVPYQGTLVDPNALADYWQRLNNELQKAGLQGVSPKAILPRTNPRRA